MADLAPSASISIFTMISTTTNEKPSLTGSRFTDFLVNEIQKNGEVLHLSDYTVATKPTNAVCQHSGPAPSVTYN